MENIPVVDLEETLQLEGTYMTDSTVRSSLDGLDDGRKGGRLAAVVDVAVVDVAVADD